MKEEMVCIQYTYVCVVSYEVLDTRVPMRKKYTKGMKTSIIPFYGNFLFLITCMKFHLTISQCDKMILNKTEKTLNKTYTGLKSFFQKFQICFSQNPSCKGKESTS